MVLMINTWREKIKYDNNVDTNFHNKKVPKENASCKCFSLVILDSVINAKEKYYPQTLLEECKYEIKKTKMERFINDDLEQSSSDDETESNSENETANESNNETKKSSKKSDNESDNE